MWCDVFIGDGSDLKNNPDWVHYRSVFPMPWDAAKALLLQRFDAFRDDECETCRADAAEAAARLREAEPGNFEANIDGDDYMILMPDSFTLTPGEDFKIEFDPNR